MVANAQAQLLSHHPQLGGQNMHQSLVQEAISLLQQAESAGEGEQQQSKSETVGEVAEQSESESTNFVQTVSCSNNSTSVSSSFLNRSYFSLHFRV